MVTGENVPVTRGDSYVSNGYTMLGGGTPMFSNVTPIVILFRRVHRPVSRVHLTVRPIAPTGNPSRKWVTRKHTTSCPFAQKNGQVAELLGRLSALIGKSPALDAELRIQWGELPALTFSPLRPSSKVGPDSGACATFVRRDARMVGQLRHSGVTLTCK
jgi:hypothetical protein